MSLEDIPFTMNIARIALLPFLIYMYINTLHVLRVIGRSRICFYLVLSLSVDSIIS